MRGAARKGGPYRDRQPASVRAHPFHRALIALSGVVVGLSGVAAQAGCPHPAPSPQVSLRADATTRPSPESHAESPGQSLVTFTTRVATADNRALSEVIPLDCNLEFLNPRFTYTNRLKLHFT